MPLKFNNNTWYKQNFKYFFKLKRIQQLESESNISLKFKILWREIYTYSWLGCLFVCMFVKTISVKTAGAIGPFFLRDLTWPRGRFMDAQNYKKFVSNTFRFYSKVWKSTKKYYWIRELFLLLFYIVQREDAHRSWIRRWAP